ncbi:MAG: hypothetical protein ACPG5U_08855 [Planktomarina sp.]
MLRLISFFAVLFILVAVGLIAYAYLGPLLGADFSAPQSQIRIPLELSTD